MWFCFGIDLSPIHMDHSNKKDQMDSIEDGIKSCYNYLEWKVDVKFNEYVSNFVSSEADQSWAKLGSWAKG